MNCRRVEGMIPLFVEGDLPSQAADRVASHLDWCGRCNWLADEYKESQSWVRSCEPPGFDEGFLADLKSTVLKRARDINPRPSLFASLVHQWNRRQILALSVASLIVLGVLVFYIYRARVNVAPLAPQIAKQAQVDPSEESNESGLAPNAGKASGVDLKVTPRALKRRGRVTARAESSTLARQAIERPSVAQGEGMSEIWNTASEHKDAISESPYDSGQMLRIEIQTSNPHIRIIWFAPKDTDWHPSKTATD